MKTYKRLAGILSLFFLFPAICISQEKNVMIKIEQGDLYSLNTFQTNLTLKKKGFKFKILLDRTEGVFVFASIRDSVYRFTETSPIRDFGYLNLLGLNEEDKFNSNKELSLSETGWSYWFYNDTAEHSFNRNIVPLDTNRFVCTKSIKTLYEVAERKTIKPKNLGSPLYLFFVAVKDYDSEGKPLTELLRRKVKIDWVEDN